MPSPFPGMNPYLEYPDRWPTVHNRLIVGLADFLTPLLLPKYQVDIDKRVYEVSDLNTLLVGKPDVTVQQSRSPRQSVSSENLVGIAATAQAPSHDEIAWANEFFAEFERDGGEIRNGSDLPRIARANKILDLARAYGIVATEFEDEPVHMPAPSDTYHY